jgi:uncharacterized oxidoreductase
VPVLPPGTLRAYVARIFEAAGTPEDDAATVAAHLVDANVLGHDSHGVIRVERYVRDIAGGRIKPGITLNIDRESDTTAVVDGGWNFGQIVAREATALAIEKARAAGTGIAVAHQCGHVGRLGAYCEQAVAEGMLGIAMVNNHGGSQVMSAPGGIARRLSPNPIAVGIPTPDSSAPFILDMTTAVVAEGKVRVARNRGESIPEGWILDAEGLPATDPAAYYGPPAGSIQPLGGQFAYKGFGLALVVEALAGALSPAGTSRPEGPSGANGLFVMAIDIARFRPPEDFAAAFGGLLDYVQSPPFAPGVERITVPGEPERAARRARAEGVAIDDETWRQLVEAGESVGVPPLTV